jgi:cytochrome c-type biogenesis protein CcmE
MKKAYWIGGVLALAFIGFGVTAFKSTLTRYVSFDEARESRSTVQVMGKLVKNSDHYDTGKQELLFSLKDEQGRVMPVTYSGIKPANFKDAISIVAIGKFDGHRLEAHQLLVKCPSKYQGAEIERQYGSRS